MKNIGILISGRGSNMVALLDAMDRGALSALCALVISNVPDAPGLALASARGVPTAVINHKESQSREEHDVRMVTALVSAGVEIVCLAGYMRLLSPIFIRAFHNRILNIHPALLPAFPGLHVQKKALLHGARFSGCTVHLVDEECDHGPIILQAVVPIMVGDTEESLSARILRYEHRLYPQALRLMCEERVRVSEGRAELLLERDAYAKLVKSLIDTGENG